MFSNLLKGLFVFFILYDINFVSVPITTARIAIMGLLFFIVVTDGIKVRKELLLITLLLMVPILFSVLQGWNSNDFTQTSRLIFFTLYSVIGAYFFVRYVRSKEELLWLFLTVCCLQSLILIYGFFNPMFKVFLGSFIEFGGNFEETNLYRSFGVTSSSGAALSVIQSIGVITAVYIMEYYRPKNNWLANTIPILGLLCLLSTVTVGRTGIVIGVIFCLFFLVKNFSYKTVIFVLILFVLDIKFLAVKILEQIDGFSTEYFVDKWLGKGMEIKDNSTLNAINDMNIPPISWDTVIGTGKIIGVRGANASGNDSGYIQTYYSLGLILSICFYIGLLWYYLIIALKYRQKDIVYLLIVVIFFIEYKEPFIFKYGLPFFLFSLLYQRDDVPIETINSNRR